jgi:hypothetical protein
VTGAHVLTRHFSVRNFGALVVAQQNSGRRLVFGAQVVTGNF